MAIDRTFLENPELLLEALAEEDPRVSSMNLTPEELQLIGMVLDEIRQDGSSALLEELYLADFWRKPPTFAEFIEDDYFLGSICKPDAATGQIGLIPENRSDLMEAFRPDRPDACSQIIYTGCVREDEHVLLQDGSYVQLKDLYGCQSLNIQTSRGDQTADTVSFSGERQCVKVTLVNGMSLTLTPDHKVECVSGHERKWIPAGELTNDDFVIVPLPSCNDEDYEISDGEIKLLAYWPTDGCATRYCPRFTDGNRETCKEVYETLLSLGWEAKIEDEYRGQDCQIVEVMKPVVGGFTDWLAMHGADTKTENAVVPPVVFRLGKRQLCLFLNRVIAAEGTVYTRSRTCKGSQTDDGFIQLRMKSERYIRQFQHLLLKVGVFSSVNEISIQGYDHPHWNVCINDANSIINFLDGVGPILGKEQKSYELLGIARKKAQKKSGSPLTRMPFNGKWLGDWMTKHGYKKYGTKWLNLIQGQKAKAVGMDTFAEWVDHHNDLVLQKCYGGIWFSRVEKVEDVGIVRTCDVANSTNLRWIANGISVHNSIGGGKTWTGMVAMLYRMCKAMCLRLPLSYYKLSQVSTLNAFILSITREQVQTGAFGDCVNMLRSSPFFSEQCAEDLTKKEFKNGQIRFQRNILLMSGSKARHAIGKNTLWAFIDEVNFRIEKAAQDAAKDMYDAITRRTKSRFGDSDDGLLVLISSSKNETDFLANHIRQNKNNPKVVISARPFWEGMGKYKIPYSGTTFRVDPGDAFSLPRILDPNEDVEKLDEQVQARLIDVPEEHRQEFESDLGGSIRDVAGVSAATSLKFFYNHLPLINSLRDELTDPFDGQNEIALSIGCEYSLEDFIDKSLFIRKSGSIVPLHYPSSPRFLHLDMSTGAQDALGMAMVHPVWKTEIDYVNPLTHIIEKRISPVFELDFCIGLRRDASGNPIDFGKVRMFLYWLRKCGFKLSVSCDLLTMSQEMINILKQNQFDVVYQSVDREKVAYSTLRTVFNEGRIGMFERPLLFSELVNVEDTGKKIDHPIRNNIPWCGKIYKEMASKDQSDALAGAILRAESRAEAFNLTLHRVGKAKEIHDKRMEILRRHDTDGRDQIATF